MKKYFKEEEQEKISLSEYVQKIETEYKRVEEELEKISSERDIPEGRYDLRYKLAAKKRELTKRIEKVKYLYQTLEDVQIPEERIETLEKTLDSSECRYGTTCLKKETIKDMYEICMMFPELTEEAILEISKIYIKDLFEGYSLIETLSMLIRKEGKEDVVFEKFIETATELADKEDKKYKEEANKLAFFYGEYSYNFITHFQKYMQEHHISLKEVGDSIPSVELISKDELQLKEIITNSKDCWMICAPLSFQMFEDYLDGDHKLSFFEEQPSYYLSAISRKIPTTFTKEQFLESIKQREKTRKR